ncbi:MAG: ankyrin repeat domain-containing protein [Deltaproteobacteria bacterium]|nr:ankyrin repeat domain-containing protein [Deltaproteobacteria bacterium]
MISKLSIIGTLVLVILQLPLIASAKESDIQSASLTSEFIVSDIRKAFTNGNFVHLDETGNRYLSEDLYTIEGNSAFARFHVGLALEMQTRDKFVAKCNEWIKANPKSSHPHVALGTYYYKLAWVARGPGMAAAASKQQWKLYEEYLRKAESEIDIALSLNAADPEAKNRKIHLLFESSDPIAEEFFLSAATQHPTYIRIFNSRAQYLLPQWRGSWEALERFADWASTVPGGWGEAHYSRIAVRSGDRRLYKATPFKWDRVKAGFEAQIERFPEDMYLMLGYAEQAWYAGDPSTAKKFFDKYGDKWDPKYERAFSQATFANIKKFAYGSDTQASTPVLDAVTAGDLAKVKMLIAKGADVNAADDRGVTPLMEAISTLQYDIARKLIDAKCDIKRKDNFGDTAANYAADVGAVHLLEPLKDAIVVGSPMSVRIAQVAAAKGHVEVMREILRLKPYLLNLGNGDGHTPLSLAIINGRLPMVQFLMAEKNIEPSLSTAGVKERMYPLHWAAQVGDLNILRAVLDALTPSKAHNLMIRRNAAGKTPYEVAIAEGHTAAAELLKVVDERRPPGN